MQNTPAISKKQVQKLSCQHRRCSKSTCPNSIKLPDPICAIFLKHSTLQQCMQGQASMPLCEQCKQCKQCMQCKQSSVRSVSSSNSLSHVSKQFIWGCYSIADGLFRCASISWIHVGESVINSRVLDLIKSWVYLQSRFRACSEQVQSRFRAGPEQVQSRLRAG